MINATSLGINKVYDLYSQPMEFHIVGDYDDTTQEWTSTGTYVNAQKDGMNNYTISSQSSDADESVTVTFTTNEYFEKYRNLKTGCTAFNNNDYFGSLYIYNAKAFGLDSDDYDATLTFVDSTTQVVTVEYDEWTDQLVVDTFGYPACMNIIKDIIITPSAT